MDQLRGVLLDSAEESVTVNQRHLIDKILARYSTEFTIFRELLQNSNDAAAEEVIIKFKTEIIKENMPILSFLKRSSRRILRIEYQNNGRPFQPQDWHRLRSIAEGNPDEQKIGFFGVGFYSLFSICEEPLITSGQECMGFFWKGDQLFTKRGILSEDEINNWTTFYMELREPMPLPSVSDFGKFCALSLAFTSSLQKLTVFYDEISVLVFDKKVSRPRDIELDLNQFKRNSQNGLFRLNKITFEQVQLDLSIMELDTCDAKSVSLFVRVVRGALSTNVSYKLAKDMERVTKKKPPKEIFIQLLWANFDQFGISQEIQKTTSIFDDFIIPPGKQGRIFIGFPTHQTTGSNFHLAAPFIPTVERENIDFVDPTLSQWNQELLNMAGIVTRLMYEDELHSIKLLIPDKTIVVDFESNIWLQRRFDYAFMSFDWQPSTPASIVRSTLSTYFNNCSTPLTVLSTCGINLISKIRIGDDEVRCFMKTTPMFFTLTQENCSSLISKFLQQNIISHITIYDVLAELRSRILTEEELIQFIKWFIKYRLNFKLSNGEIMEVMNSVKISSSLNFANIKYVCNQRVIPDMPLSSDTLPSNISKPFSSEDLIRTFDSWKVLSISNWLRFALNSEALSHDALFLEKMLGIVSRNINNCSNEEKTMIQSILSTCACIPTTEGIRLPRESYTKSVTLFKNLPLVQLKTSRHTTDSFLKSIGVRDHVELQLIFDRLSDLTWNHVHLIKYLTSVSSKLTSFELERLKATAMFPQQRLTTEKNGTRFRASDLYHPSEIFKELEFPILEWDEQFRINSDEARFLHSLGLHSHIELDRLIELASDSKYSHRSKLLSYFIENRKTLYNNYSPNKISRPFLPCSSGIKDNVVLALPSDCFWDERCKLLGVKILQPELKVHAHTFGVRESPNVAYLHKFLQKNPPSTSLASDVFSYFAQRSQEFSESDWKIFKAQRFVPIKKNGIDVWFEPSVLYFSTKVSFFSEQFEYVDFGPVPNSFLRSCGVRDEPSPHELAIEMIRDPERFLSNIDTQKYMSILRQIAANYQNLRRNATLLRDMKKSAFLMGLKRASNSKDEISYQLCSPQDILLIDDTILQQLFNPLSCPIEKLLEDMYQDLGSKWISQEVKVIFTPSKPSTKNLASDQLQVLIRERAALLLYNGAHPRPLEDVFGNAEQLLSSLNVLSVNKIEISRQFQGRVDSQCTSACMYQEKNVGNQLYVTDDYDFFDVSSCLCAAIFKRSRVNDHFLVSTLLSTPLESLKRKGFPVDRVSSLTASKKKEAVSSPTNTSSEFEAPRIKNTELKAVNRVEDSLFNELQDLFPEVASPTLRSLIQQFKSSPDIISDISNTILNEKDKPLTARKKEPDSIGDTFKKFAGMFGVFGPLAQSPFPQQVSSEKSISRDLIQNTDKNSVIEPALPPSIIPDTITDTNQDSAKIKKSNEALKSSLHQSIKTLKRAGMPEFSAYIPPEVIPDKQIKSSCLPIMASDLIHHTTIQGIMVFMDKKIENSQISMEQRAPEMTEFVKILSRLCTVMKMPVLMMHVYWDDSGTTVAFNRDRTLFFNFRYYLLLHSKDFKKAEVLPGGFNSENGKSSVKVYSYWYMTLCHELAHNFVSAHDALHEFYLASFAEEFMPAFIAMLEMYDLV